MKSLILLIIMTIFGLPVVAASGASNAVVLFVIDNSAGMELPQEKLAEAIPDLVELRNNFNIRVGVVTTDMSKDSPRLANGYGSLQGGKLIRFDNGEKLLSLNSADPSEATEMLRRAVVRPETAYCRSKAFDPTSCPSPDERGIRATNIVLETIFSKYSIDAGSPVIVFVLSDEDEGSFGTMGGSISLAFDDRPIQVFTNWRNLYGGHQISVFPIIVRPQDQACLRRQSIPPLRAYEGYVYAELSARTNGQIFDICAESYSSIFDSVFTKIEVIEN